MASEATHPFVDLAFAFPLPWHASSYFVCLFFSIGFLVFFLIG